MGTLIRLELRKMLLKKRMFIVWVGVIFLSFVSITDISIDETYAMIFSKGYGLVPLMGLMMFMMFSGGYTSEYSSNMGSLIKTTKYGKREFVIGKALAAGIGALIINLSIFLTVCLSGLTKFKFAQLNLPLKNLWYFGKSGSDITVIQMILIMVITIIIGSFFFAQLGLFLSSISKSAAIPFIFGGLIMGIPYIADDFLPRELVKYLGLTPLWGMMSCQIIRYKVPVIILIIGIAVMGVGILLLPRLTLKAFLKDK
ncbi:hypothetical protein [Oceanirhabdus sp. W0125-5]|uniref:hypothetical protein n=1 Tax=Oceanirhabdus sp. W0125-5 TaxID=2999116 RepID=UPI0022F3067A|nr:hypothetical protein [Oceanirhabdus sp. W0125-5]WBW97768.1 hypothetical protein OW730_03015 [Oceanirhabdus sp. W0125-5]